MMPNKFEHNPLVWSKKKTKLFDVFVNTPDNPTIIIPLGADKGIHHAIATGVGNYIFDSTHLNVWIGAATPSSDSKECIWLFISY